MSFLTHITYGLVAGFGLYTTANAAVLQRISDWGPNPSKIAQLHVYVPDRVAAKPPIILGVTLPFKMYTNPWHLLRC
jgi:hypothetical protein